MSAGSTNNSLEFLVGSLEESEKPARELLSVHIDHLLTVICICNRQVIAFIGVFIQSNERIDFIG